MSSVHTLSGHELPVAGRVDLPLERGLPYNPDRHQVTETLFAQWAQQEFLNPDLFTYRHLEANSWMLAQWLDDGHSTMVEVWGTEPGTATQPLDQLLQNMDFAEVSRRIKLATAVRSEVAKLALNRKREEAAQLAAADLMALEKRAELVRFFRHQLEREGRPSDANEKFLHDLADGTTPYQPAYGAIP